MKQVLKAWQHRFAKSLTLRWRLTLWTAGLLFVLGLGLLLLINGLTTTRVPQAVSTVLLPTQHSPSESLRPVASPMPSLVQVTPPPIGEVDTLADIAYASAIDQVQEIAIREVRFISLVGVGLFTLLGALGAHWIARQALHPVHRLSRLVREIRAESLGQRLSVDGPQDEVKEFTDAFNHTLERLERVFEQQGRFVADAAHELRTPLATLRTNLEVVLRNPRATLADYRETANVLERALDRLERLVNGLLLLAQGEKDIRVEPVYLEVLIGDVIQELEPLAQSHQVSLHCDITEVVLQADAPLLARAVSNLIENGIRYNHPAGSVTITVRREANEVVVRVADTGIGIPLEEQAHIFDRFYRIDRSRARHRGGSGLGLSITAHIVQLHGGRIQVESTPSVGSTFTMRLPL